MIQSHPDSTPVVTESVKTKTCIKCDVEKPVTDFYIHRKGGSWRINTCIPCLKVINEVWRNVPENRERWNRGRHFKKLEKQFGLTREEFDELYRDPRCRGCGATESTPRRTGRGLTRMRLALDHSHVTGKRRGLLCHDCNRTIATAHDSPAVLRALADYLEQSSEQAQVN